MKTAIPLALAALLALLISWGIYEFTSDPLMASPMMLISFVTMAVCLGIGLGVRLQEYPRSTQVIRTTSLFVNGVLLTANILFALFAHNLKYVILTDGIILLVYLVAVWGVSQSKQ